MTILEPIPKTIMSLGAGPLVAEIILVFASNTEVLNVEDCLEEMDLAFELVPVPKEVNANCGLAISFKEEGETEIKTVLAGAGFSPLASYWRQGDCFLPWPFNEESGEDSSKGSECPS